jgi:hypothetical protein
MAIKKKLAEQQKNAEIALDKINADLESVLRGTREKKRNFIEKQTWTAVDDFAQHIVKMNKGHILKVKDWVDAMQYEEGEFGNIDTHTIRKAYNEIAKIVGPSGSQVSHQGSGVLTNQLFIMYTRLTQISNMMGSGNYRTIPKSDIADGDTAIKNKKPRRTVLSQEKTQALAEQIRQLWISSKAVSQMHISEFTGNSVQDLDTALEIYYHGLTQEKHFINKENEVNSLTGVISQKLTVEEQSKRSDVDKLIGTAKNNAFDGDELKGLKGKLKKYEKNFGDIVGSKAITNEVMKQLTDVALGKKPKPYKSNSRPKKLKKRPVKASPNSKKLKKAIKESGKLTMPALAVKVMREAGSTEDQLNVIKLKSMINKRLPAEIRRNMGRPALINRTGRFSNSAQVLNLKDTAQGVSGDYTYTLNPYQTFENTGQRKWPIAYNPKTLITKSIRNLAMQYTEQKLTILRRR